MDAIKDHENENRVRVRLDSCAMMMPRTADGDRGREVCHGGNAARCDPGRGGRHDAPRRKRERPEERVWQFRGFVAVVAPKNEQKPKAKVKAAAAQKSTNKENIRPTTTVLYMRVYLLNKNCKSSAVNCESAA